MSRKKLSVPFFLVLAVACNSKPDPHANHTGSAAPVSDASSVAAHINNTAAPGPAPEGMVWIPGGEFWMGCDDCGMPDALPVHLVSVAGFWMDTTPVTNEEFERFVRATRYVTVAERKPDPKDFPGVPPENLVPGSIVFPPPTLDQLNRERNEQGLPAVTEVPLENHFLWWRYVP